jgi:hypothetical protein
MYRVLFRFSFDNDKTGLTTKFTNALGVLTFTDAGTGLLRSNNLNAAQLAQFFTLLGQNLNIAQGGANPAFTLDHYIIAVEKV